LSNPDYAVYIASIPDNEGGGYIAHALELPGCMSDGNTQEEALANLHDAIDSWIGRAEVMGRNIPQPTPEKKLAYA
jgi:predicted RNase H-like HicB family nuclease